MKWMEIDQDYLRTGTGIGSRASHVQISCLWMRAETFSGQVSYILYTYDWHHNFVWSPTIEKFNPFHPANFSQFKHCGVVITIWLTY